MDLQGPKNNLHDILNDPTIPIWKKDLIVRKRNTNRLLFGNIKYSCPSLSVNIPSTSNTSSTLTEAIRDSCGGVDDDCCSTSMKSPTSPTSIINFSSDDDTVLNNSKSSSSVEDFHLCKNNVTLNTPPKANGEEKILKVEGNNHTSSTCENYTNDSSSTTPVDEKQNYESSTVCKSDSNCSEENIVLCSSASSSSCNNEMRLENNIVNNNNSSNNNSDNNIIKKVKIKKRNNNNMKMGEEKVKMKNSTRKLSVPTNSSSPKEITTIMDSNEEIKYGPGIVHKLRDRYINITLREAASNYNKRPPLSSMMRRASSLDNILDDIPAGRNKNNSNMKETALSPPPVNNITHPTKYISTGKYNKKSDKYTSSTLKPSRQESLKRVRSMETLLIFDGHGKPSTPLVNEDIVIIEQSKPVVSIPRKRTSSGSVPSEDEMPPPDVVRQTRQKFERRSINTTTINNTTIPRITKKPALSPKPVFETSSKTAQKENKPATTIKMPTPPPLPLPTQKYILDKKQTSTKLSPTSEKVKSIVSATKLSPTSEKVTTVKSPVTSPTEIVPPKIIQNSVPKVTSPTTKPPSPPVVKSSPPVVVKNTTNKPVNQIPKVTSPSKSPSPTSPIIPTTNGSKEEKEEEENDLEENTKIISEKALENIRRNGFSFEISPKSSPNLSHLPGSRSPSPQVISVQQKINDKQVGIIRPITKTPSPPIVENNRTNVNEKNLINSVKNEKPNNNTIINSNNTSTTTVTSSLKTEKNTYVSPPNFSKPIPQQTLHITTKIEQQPILRTISTPSPPTVLSVVKSTDTNSELWGANKRHYNDQSSTQLFDFTSSKSPVPDYIENDGVVIRRPTSTGGKDTGDDFPDAGPPSPVRNIEVIGGNVLINGRSNLKKNPKTNKLRIKFDDGATSTFEYPSEASLLIDDNLPGASTPSNSVSPVVSSVTQAGDVSQSAPRAALQPLPSGSGSLASYTPSKILMTDETFELGVTRAAAATTPVVYLSDAHQEESSDFLLKPAEGEDSVAWSSETASDLLF